MMAAEEIDSMPEIYKKNAEKIEIYVRESDVKDLMLLDRSDLLFAAIYGVLFLWGLCFTLISI